MGLPSIPRSSARPRSSPGATSSRRRWRATGPAAPTGHPGGNTTSDYGTSAAPLPIQSWQVWNEPNLRKYFGPGSTSLQAKANKYARLLAISHDAIKSKDPRATIVLAGMPSTTRAAGSSNARDFLNAIYNVAGVKADFDAAALHPYGCELDRVRTGISQFRAVMENRGDGATPLWLTEFAWGSGPEVLHQQGRHGPAKPADQLLQDVPAKPKDLERAATVLVPVARSDRQLRDLLQLLWHRGAFAPRPQPEARLLRLQGLHG